MQSFPPYLRHEHKERLRTRVESPRSKTEFLAALERGNLFNQDDARRSTEKRRRYRNKLTLLMYSRRFTMLCSNCCFLACGRHKTNNINVKKEIKGLFEATTILHDEVHASVWAEKMKIFWLCCKNKFLSPVPYLNLLKSSFNHWPNSAIQ